MLTNLKIRCPLYSNLRLYDKWSEMLLNLVAKMEASIDFSDDVGNVDEAEMKINVKELLEAIELHMNDANAGERLRSGVQVCIVGKPNVGKSTLLNMLCQRPAAIVSPIAGTTRDTIEQHLDVGGFPVKIVDTAGLRDSVQADTIELEGMKRATDVAKSSDLIIILIDSNEIPSQYTTDQWCSDILKNLSLKNTESIKLFVLNKCDLLSQRDVNRILESFKNTKNMCLMSCLTKNGMETFTEILKDHVQEICTGDQGTDR